jgi:hypothetical protein
MVFGPQKSPYYVKKEHELREIYKCMHHLTFLDYDAALESGGRIAEMKLQEKQREIEQFRELDFISRDAIRILPFVRHFIRQNYCANNPSTMNFMLTSMIAISTILLKTSWFIILTILLPMKEPARAIPNKAGK